MRAHKHLVDDVNVRTHAQRAAERVAGNGSQRHLHVPQPYNPEHNTVSLWQRVVRLFPTPEKLDVAGREVKGFIVPHWAAGVILAAILSIGWAVYGQVSAQRDMLIRLDTQLQERDKHELEYRNEFKVKTNVQQLQIDNMTTQLAAVKAMLSPEQVRSIERNARKDN